jgi:hypothetical protein
VNCERSGLQATYVLQQLSEFTQKNQLISIDVIFAFSNSQVRS